MHNLLRKLIPIPKIHRVFAQDGIVEYYAVYCPFKKEKYDTNDDYWNCILCDKPLYPAIHVKTEEDL